MLRSLRCYYCSCNRARTFYIYPEQDACYFQCKGCGLIWLDPEKRIINNQEYYNSVYYKEGYSGRDNHDKAFSYRFRIINRYFRTPGRLLEIGAASGDFLHLLRTKGYTVEGVELSKRAVDVAKEKYSLYLFQGTLKEASFDDERFDYIIMYHVLEHVADPIALLRETHRILRKGGIILIEVPHPTSLDAQLSEHLLKNILDYPNHIYLYPPSLLKKMIVHEGFKVLSKENSFSFLLVEYFKKLTHLLQAKTKQEVTPQTVMKDVFDVQKKLYSDNFIRKCAKKFFPGMRLTILGQKI